MINDYKVVVTEDVSERKLITCELYLALGLHDRVSCESELGILTNEIIKSFGYVNSSYVNNGSKFGSGMFNKKTERIATPEETEAWLTLYQLDLIRETDYIGDEILCYIFNTVMDTDPEYASFKNIVKDKKFKLVKKE